MPTVLTLFICDSLTYLLLKL